MAVRNAGKLLDVEHVDARVGYGFAKQHLGVGLESSGYFLLRGVDVDKGGFDAQFAEGDVEQIECSAIDLRAANHMVASLADIENGIEIGCLTRRCEHRCHAAFECGNLCCHCIVGGVLQTGVEISRLFEVEQAAHLLATLIFECSALIYWKYTGFAILWRIAGLNA